MDTQPLYSLTAMSGCESSSARTVVGGVAELPWRVLIILVVAFLTGLPIMAMLWLVAGVYALGFLALWLAGAVWLFHGRTSALEIRNYAVLLNRRRAILNQFMLGPATVTVPHGDWRIIRAGSVANPELRVLPEEQAARQRRTSPDSLVTAVFDG